jgi:hypothetical protein
MISVAEEIGYGRRRALIADNERAGEFVALDAVLWRRGACSISPTAASAKMLLHLPMKEARRHARARCRRP